MGRIFIFLRCCSEQVRWFITNVLGERIGPISNGQDKGQYWPLQMGPTCCAETLVTNQPRQHSSEKQRAQLYCSKNMKSLTCMGINNISFLLLVGLVLFFWTIREYICATFSRIKEVYNNVLTLVYILLYMLCVMTV
jgi:hypothetical protein